MIIKEYDEKLCEHKYDNLDEMDQSTEKHKWPKIPQRDIDQLNRPI